MGEMSRATQALRAARKIVFFTGTGISAESGIPTFGDKLTGHWTKHDVLHLHGSLATPICFACKRPANLIVPSSYGCPPTGPTQQLLDQLGRHGQRPAHIHFFISAPGYRHLTTQINLSDDPYLHDDFAYATRDELIADGAGVGRARALCAD